MNKDRSKQKDVIVCLTGQADGQLWLQRVAPMPRQGLLLFTVMAALQYFIIRLDGIWIILGTVTFCYFLVKPHVIYPFILLINS